MCSLNVQVEVVSRDRLGASWAVAVDRSGHRCLFLSEAAAPGEVAEGYAQALRQCPVRIKLELIA